MLDFGKKGRLLFNLTLTDIGGMLVIVEGLRSGYERYERDLNDQERMCPVIAEEASEQFLDFDDNSVQN